MKTLPLYFFTDKLDRGEPFSFARYGDGEWNCILGAQGENCDHHAYTPELAADLARTLTEPRDYLYAMGPKVAGHKSNLAKPVFRWLQRNGKARNVVWHSTETLLNASLDGTLKPFVDSLRKRHVMIVGPAHLRKVEIANSAFVEVPLVNCYTEKERIEKEIYSYSSIFEVILLSAGMASKAMIWDLYPQIGQSVTMIDCGSMWDMYCGIDSRSYARKLSPERKLELARLNGLTK